VEAFSSVALLQPLRALDRRDGKLLLGHGSVRVQEVALPVSGVVLGPVQRISVLAKNANFNFESTYVPTQRCPTVTRLILSDNFIIKKQGHQKAKHIKTTYVLIFATYMFGYVDLYSTHNSKVTNMCAYLNVAVCSQVPTYNYVENVCS
jgi:hypothetical protein